MTIISRILIASMWSLALLVTIAVWHLGQSQDACRASETRIRQLESRWRRMADECRRNAVPENGATLDQCADELQYAREQSIH